MLLTLESTGAAVAPRSDRSLIRADLSEGNRAPSGTLNTTIPSPSIPAHGQLTRDLNFQAALHDLYEFHIVGRHFPKALGAYACGKEAFSHHPGWSGSYFRITDVLQAQAAQGVRAETKVATGRFAADVGYGNCGVENFSQR